MTKTYRIEDVSGQPKYGWQEIRCDSLSVSNSGVVFFYEHTEEAGISGKNLMIVYNLIPGESLFYNGED